MKTFIPCFLCFILISCSKSENPAEPQYFINYGCFPSGVYLDFVDSCSYGFVITFLQQFDSIQIGYSELGSDFVIYADSGDYNYWIDLFKEDQTINYIFKHYTTSDSLILQFKLSGEKSVEEEQTRFESFEHLKILSITEHEKLVSLDVSPDASNFWANFFKKFNFIDKSQVVMICID